MWYTSAILKTLLYLGNTCFRANCNIESHNPYKTCCLLLILKPLSQQATGIHYKMMGLISILWHTSPFFKTLRKRIRNWHFHECISTCSCMYENLIMILLFCSPPRHFPYNESRNDVKPIAFWLFRKHMYFLTEPCGNQHSERPHCRWCGRHGDLKNCLAPQFSKQFLVFKICPDPGPH